MSARSGVQSYSSSSSSSSSTALSKREQVLARKLSPMNLAERTHLASFMSTAVDKYLMVSGGLSDADGELLERMMVSGELCDAPAEFSSPGINEHLREDRMKALRELQEAEVTFIRTKIKLGQKRMKSSLSSAAIEYVLAMLFRDVCEKRKASIEAMKLHLTYKFAKTFVG